MKVITILNQGTANDSTDRGTSNGCELVVSKLAKLMRSTGKLDWIMNEGVGTGGLQKQGAKTDAVSGILFGRGLEANVQRALDLVETQRKANGGGGIMVNLVGHSRGSITCYKIARAMRDNANLQDIVVNIFAIDPVPGNVGVLNHENWRDIALGGNLRNTFLLLAESDRRLPFRPYVDALYSMGMPDHKFDTIPGTHAGINELGGAEKEAAAIVLSKALEFLRANDTPLKENDAAGYILDGNERLEQYSTLMQKIKKYKRHGKSFTMRVVGMLRMEDRHVMVHGPKEDFGTDAQGEWTGVDTAESQTWARGGYHGLDMEKAVGKMLPGDEVAHSTRPHRYFANLDHQTLFCGKYGGLGDLVRRIERGTEDIAKFQDWISYYIVEYAGLGLAEKVYFDGWLAKKGLIHPGGAARG